MVDGVFFKISAPCKLVDLVAEFGGDIGNGDGDLLVNNVATLRKADEGDISFFSNQKYIEQLKLTKASVCILGAEHKSLAPETTVCWTVSNPYEVWAKVLTKLYPENSGPKGLHHAAYISSSAQVASDVYIGAGAYVGDGAVIEKGCHIAAGCYIGAGVRVGSNCAINHGVTITHAHLGRSCIIHPGVRIGQDGFGFAPGRAGVTKIQQLGRVIIGDHVEIGANTCIDRGAIDDTTIGHHTKIDNLVQIAHNVTIGNHCIIVSQTGIAGSSSIGDGTVLGGQCGVSGHVNVGCKVTLAARGAIIKDTLDGEVLGGVPAVPIRQWHKQTAILRKLANPNGNKDESS